MNRKSARFRAVDVLLIAMMILPLAAGWALKILTTPASEGIEISGARIYFTIPMPVQDLPITEKSGEFLAGDDLHPGVVPVSGTRHHREAGQQAPAGGGMDCRKDQRSGTGKHGQALHGLRALCGGHYGPVCVFQPDEPGRPSAPDFRYERRGRMGDSGVRAHHPLQAQGRPWALCEGLLRAGAGLCAL